MQAQLYFHLHPKAPCEEVIAGALVSVRQLDWAVQAMGKDAVAWALEEAAISMERLQGEFQSVPDLPTSEIRLNLETLILDIFMSCVGNTNDHQTLKLIPSMARQAARREVPFSSIVKNMRGNQILWINNFLRATTDQAISPGAVQRLITSGAGVVDELIERFVLSYLEERQTLMEGQIAKRRALVEKLISNEVFLDSLSFNQIRDDHGLDLSHFHIGLIITDINTKHSPDLGKLQRILQDVATGSTALFVAATQHVTWAWVSTAHCPTQAQLKRLGDTIANVRGIRCTTGEPARGLSGFRRTHLQAIDVSKVAIPTSVKGVLRWSDHLLTILVGQDLEKAAWYVQAVLGPLADNSAKAEGYRQTLNAYLNSGHSLLHGAERLGIHRNTLVYRLQQLEDLLTYPIKERELELRCALHLVNHFAVHVLREEDTEGSKNRPTL